MAKKHVYVTYTDGDYDHLFGDYSWEGLDIFYVKTTYGEYWFTAGTYRRILVSDATMEEVDIDQYQEIINDLEGRGVPLVEVDEDD